MIPIVLGLSGLIAKAAAVVAVSRVAKVVAALASPPACELTPAIEVHPASVAAPEQPAPVIKTPASQPKAVPGRWQIRSQNTAQTPSLPAWWAPTGARGPPLQIARSSFKASLHPRSYPINSSDPSGLEPPGGGGTWFSNMDRDPNAASIGDVMTGAENHARGWFDFLLWFTPMPEVKGAKAAGRFIEGAHLVRPAISVRIAEGAQYYEKELEAAKYFGNLGHQFEITKLTKEAVGADVWLVAENGARVGFDVKTLGAASKNAVVQNIRELGKGSVAHAIVDGRSAGLTRMQAISYAKAGLARYSKNLEEIRFITTGGEVIWRR